MGDFDDVTANQFSAMEQHMGREAYEAQIAAQQAQIRIMEEHAALDRIRAHRVDVITEVIRGYGKLGLGVAAAVAFPVVVNLWRRALR